MSITPRLSSPTFSPPPVAIAQGGITVEGSAPRESPASPAFSTTSTAESGSSPIIPALPAPTVNGRTLDLLRTPPSEPRTESSRYYTASWGSPYPEFLDARSTAQSHRNTLSSDTSEDSPLRVLELHTPYLRPAPAFARSQTDAPAVSHSGVSAAVLANRARRPARGLTEDWIRQHTVGELGTERLNWLSDSNGSEHSSLSGSEAVDWTEDIEPKTPTLRSFVERQAQHGPQRHARQPSTDTVTQTDFETGLEEPFSRMSTDSNPGSEGPLTLKVSEAKSTETLSEKPLPAPPQEASKKSGIESSSWRGADNDPTPSPAPIPPRLGKKVPWRGKNIAILIPWNDERGQKGKAPMPMNPTDVEKMLKDWEKLGYNVTGFNIGELSLDAVEAYGQSRGIWPRVEIIREERQAGKWRVSIPDRRHWDAYVEELREAKLRALGVSLSHDEPAVSPVPSAMSRTTSMQYPPLPFSPPIPTSSTSSHAPHHPGLFSPTIVPNTGQSTSQSSNVSVVSPASMHAQMYGKFNPRVSVSIGSGEHPFGSPHPFPQQSSPVVWSSPQILYQQGLAKGGSPSVHNLSAAISPASPFKHDGYFPHHPDLSIQLQRQQQFPSPFSQQLHSDRQSPRLQELQEDGDDSTIQKSPSKTPEPSQFIKHNPSDSLQKEIDDAEYHLEEQFQRQLEHDDYSPHSDKEGAVSTVSDLTNKSHTRNASSFHGGLAASRFAEDSGPILHHPQPHSRGHSLSQRPFESDDSPALGFFGESSKMDRLSEIETNPSHLGTPVFTNDLSHQRSLSNSTNPWLESDAAPAEDPKPKEHLTKASVSKLNVEAPEFKFNPTNTFQPGNFAFGGSIFQPAVSAHQSFVPGHSVNNSFGVPVKSKINVTAPAFQPGQTDFSFSSSGPTFRPDAPAFTPLNSTDSASGTDGSSLRNSIFGKIDLPLTGIVKPPKKSKAIPIVRPDSADRRTSEDDNMEDKDGRITQGVGRIKRVRGTANDGDTVPLFAEPCPEPMMPLQETSREQSPPKEQVTIISTKADKENLPIDTLHIVPLISTKPLGGGKLMDVSPDYDGKGWAPWEFQQQGQVEEFSSASAYPVHTFQDFELHEQSGDSKNKASETEEPKKHKKNSLSALAKPFEFTSSWFGSSFGGTPKAAVPPPAPTPPIKAPAPARGLAASRYATTTPPPPNSPPREVVESPAISLDEEEKSAFQEALPRPQSSSSQGEEDPNSPIQLEPTFEEIDAVMRHMNEVENKVSPSRDIDTPRWHQLNPSRRIQIPGVIESSPIRLQPPDDMRSDAPSPSPRRFQPLPGGRPGQRVFSRVHDPFLADTSIGLALDSPVHRLNEPDDVPHSDWDDVLSESEAAKFHARTHFFDNRVNDLVDGLLAERLDPLEKILGTIQLSLATMTQIPSSNRHDRRSVSGELPESDADDEDDEHQRSRSPRKDKKLEKIRSIVNEALASHQPSQGTSLFGTDASDVLRVLEDMKEQFGQSIRLDLRGEDLRNIVEEAIERRMPTTPQPPPTDEAAAAKIADLDASILLATRRAHSADERMEEEMQNRRAAEDLLAKAERLLHNASEEQERLREALGERDQKLKSIDNAKTNTTTRIAMLEAAAEYAEKGQSELSSKANQLEVELRHAHQQAHHWQSEAEKSSEAVRHHKQDMDHAKETNVSLRRLTETLRLQMEESLRLRESMRGKLGGLQEDMAKTAREISQENAKRAKKEQKLVARQEVLDARLQAEARTRERLEKEILRLEAGERDGMRAVSESKRLEALLTQLRTEAHESEKNTMRYLREAEEARLSAASEAKRHEALAGNLRAELHEAEQATMRHQRGSEEAHEASLRNWNESQRLEASLRSELHESEKTAMRYQREAEEAREARAESMKLEALAASLRAELQESQLTAARYKREFEETRESGLSEVQRTRQCMQAEIELANTQVNIVRQDLEEQVARLRVELDQVRLDANTSQARSEMLLEEAVDSRRKELEGMARKHANEIEDVHTQQERQISNAVETHQRAELLLLERLGLSSARTEHLQDRVTHLEERLEIARAAALAAAQSARGVGAGKPTARASEVPERISPQALRESIMVLQEQLQDREQTIEQLEQQLSTVDPDAAAKMAKRDDEISWLRELLAVRAGDVQDIVSTLADNHFDATAVRDAAIRLKANLQMEQQERERSGILPNIAATLKDAAATPRVAQVVGPVAAAWGHWRRSQEPTPTPSKAAGGFLSGLLTPPATRTPQPTAFGTTGRRLTANRAMASRREDVAAAPATPPITRAAEDLSDAGFYDDDESTVDDSMFGAGR